MFCNVLSSQSEEESKLLLRTTVDSCVCVFIGFYRCCGDWGRQQKVTTGSLRSTIECKVPGSRLHCVSSFMVMVIIHVGTVISCLIVTKQCSGAFRPDRMYLFLLSVAVTEVTGSIRRSPDCSKQRIQAKLMMKGRRQKHQGTRHKCKVRQLHVLCVLRGWDGCGSIH